MRPKIAYFHRDTTKYHLKRTESNLKPQAVVGNELAHETAQHHGVFRDVHRGVTHLGVTKTLARSLKMRFVLVMTLVRS